MAVGTPVITSTTSSLPEVVGETAFTCDPSNVQEMTRTIIEALHDSDDWTRRSEAQFARAHLFNWEAIGEQTAKVIQEAINA
jgi:glycosyltransferase involved in cell wall biosynthesis